MNDASLFDRVPPHDDDAERAALGGMLVSKDAIGEISQALDPEDFYQPNHQTIYETILAMFSAGDPVDSVTVATKLDERGDLQKIGGVNYLHDLASEVPTAANALYYAEIVHQRALLRRVIATGTKITQLGYNAGGAQAQDVINLAQAEAYEMGEGKVHQDYVPLRDAVNTALDQIDRIQKGEIEAGIPTGFREIDAMTKGLQPGQMVVVAGRPAMGKSTLGVDFARSAALKHHEPTVIFSLEMSRIELAQRIIAAETNIPLAAMRNPDDIDPGRWNVLNDFYGKLESAPLYIDDSPNMSLMEIRAKCPASSRRRASARGDRLSAAHELGQAGGKPPAGGLRVLARAQAARERARTAGRGVESAQPQFRDAQRPQAADLRPARIRLDRAGRRRDLSGAPPRRL